MKNGKINIMFCNKFKSYELNFKGLVIFKGLVGENFLIMQCYLGSFLKFLRQDISVFCDIVYSFGYFLYKGIYELRI